MEEFDEPQLQAVPAPELPRNDRYPRVVVVLAALVGLVLLGSALGAVLSMAIGQAAGWDEALFSGSLAADAPASERWALRTILGINHLFSFVLAGWATAFFFYRNYRNERGAADWRDYLGIQQWPAVKTVILACLLMLASVPLVLFLYNINQALPIPETLRMMEDNTNEAIKGLLQMDNLAELLVNLIIIALLPAVGEELVFRGVFQKQLHRRIANPWVVIVLAGAVFSAIHLQFEGFLPRWMLGITLGWLYWRTGNLWVSMAAHFFNNAIQVVAQYLYSRELSTVDLEQDISMPWYGATLSLILFLYLMQQIDKGIQKTTITQQT
ncbi:MAG: CPBP family intramembrane metalloprotease [Lewinellaceae bacterium]|nr:CPBP family intramembrane metalloprotease [Lewinellaceae bacterium]